VPRRTQPERDGAESPEGRVDDVTPAQFAKLFKRLTLWADEEYFTDDDDDAPHNIGDDIRDFLGDTPAIGGLANVTFPNREHPNVHLAVEKMVNAAGRTSRLLGWLPDTDFGDWGLIQVMRRNRYHRAPEGPPRYRSVEVRDDGHLSWLEAGLFLVEAPEGRWVVCITMRDRGIMEDVRVDIAAGEQTVVESRIQELRAEMRSVSVYRGAVLSLAGDAGRGVEFQKVAHHAREDLILPAALLDAVERNSIGFSAHAEGLLRAGRHLRRGLLLHGAPGTGKSLTVEYLIGAMKDRTTLLLSAEDLALIKQTCELARALAPSTVVLEDVDLIARSRKDEDANYPALFRLMNEMDGIAPDDDVMFILTTNRPEVLEPALAARPGRIDQAFEFPLPDEACRRRLVELYGRGMTIEESVIERIVRRTAGASGAFIRELLRKAVLMALQSRSQTTAIEIRFEDLDEALNEMVILGGELTSKLLGASSKGIGFVLADADEASVGKGAER
jgi:predicted AAA+ superfamily ATPase